MFNEKIICLSHLVTPQTPSFANQDRFKLKAKSEIKHGASSNTSTWEFSNNHIGTHMDAPNHFCDNGLKTFEIPKFKKELNQK